ncbi:hypothetical protein PG993_013323 [Apiospora rasikravindrae]|uniref:F-box domain-containing protein n=1 Tax=Apiospora rasikravindrae TaxID=990691 RepID=A0ABR1RXB2_9PEZI
MAQLPNEIYRQILSPLDLESLQACRLAGRSINQAATELLFRRVTLRVELAPAQSAISSFRFIQIATAPHLRPLVREVAIKTTVPSVAFTVGDFMAPLPMNHGSLEIGFSGTKTSQGAGPGLLVHECGPFASLVLDTCLRCLTGEWSPGRQAWLQKKFLQAIQATDSQLSTNWPPLVTSFCAERIEAAALKITDLPVSLEVAVTEMLVSCKSLTNLQLRFASSAWESFHNLPRQLGDRFDYFQRLPKVWFPPAIAQHLRVLSLSYDDYWGWTPRMDFRTVNPGIGLPNLRVLSLGCYVFSHEWQVDWIASLGRQNGRGGLEELYLKDCPIMWEARVHSALDDSITELQTGNGEVVRISNEGYPTNQSLQLPDNLSGLIEVSFPLRWSDVLDRWANSALSSTLKTFLPAATPGLLQYVHFNIGLDPEPWIEQDDRRSLVMEEGGLDKYMAARKSDNDSYDNFMDIMRRRRQSDIDGSGDVQTS